MFMIFCSPVLDEATETVMDCMSNYSVYYFFIGLAILGAAFIQVGGFPKTSNRRANEFYYVLFVYTLQLFPNKIDILALNEDVFLRHSYLF